MKPAILVVTGLAVAMAACAPQTPVVDVTAETEALRATVTRYNAAVEALDGAGLAAFYADDCQIMPTMTMAKMARKARIRVRVVRMFLKPVFPWLRPPVSVR